MRPGYYFLFFVGSFNRAARFARLVAPGLVPRELSEVSEVSIGPRVSRGWWLPLRLAAEAEKVTRFQ